MRIALVFCFFVVIVGCQSDFFNQTHSFENYTWNYDDPLAFSFEIEDTTKIFDMILTVKHTDQYPFQNLYVKTISLTPGDTAVTQNLSLEMANQGGYWLGTCSGINCEIDIPIQSKIHFKNPGLHRIEVEQFTRTDTLIGIRSLGLRLEEIQ